MSTALTATPMNLPLPSSSVQAYIQAAREIPLLSPAEERSLALRLRDDSDLDAARQLILAHLRFVVHIARSYGGYGLPLGDLIQEGNVGLMKAVKRYDPDRGVRLVSFAVHWIRAEMHEFILRNWRIVKIATTKAQRKLFFNLRSAKQRLGWFSKDEAEAVARDLGVSPAIVTEMEARLAGQDISFDPAPETDREDGESFSPAGYLSDPQADPAEFLERQDWQDKTESNMLTALDALDPRSRDIVRARWLSDSKPTLEDLGTRYGVSAERIRQLEAAALKKLKGKLKV